MDEQWLSYLLQIFIYMFIMLFVGAKPELYRHLNAWFLTWPFSTKIRIMIYLLFAYWSYLAIDIIFMIWDSLVKIIILNEIIPITLFNIILFYIVKCSLIELWLCVSDEDDVMIILFLLWRWGLLVLILFNFFNLSLHSILINYTDYFI